MANILNHLSEGNHMKLITTIKAPIGKKFGHLTILEEVDRKDRRRMVKCICDCNNKTVKSIDLFSVLDGRSKSCGCTKRKFVDILNKTFNRLTAIEFIGYIKQSDGKHHPMWRFVCTCNKEIILSSTVVRHGKFKSCGCLKKEISDRCLKNGQDKLRLPKGVAAFNRYYSIYKRTAKIKNREFKLSQEEFRLLIFDNCYYCNQQPTRQHPKPNPRAKHSDPNGFIYVNGIDRIDSNKEYTIDNCVSCCYDCNKAKMAMSVNEFVIWLNKIYHHFIEGKNGNVQKNYLEKMDRPVSS